MSTTGKFVHDDVVKNTKTGQTGTIKGFRHEQEGFIYRVLLRGDAAEEIDMPEGDIELVRIANDDETGFAIRYIS